MKVLLDTDILSEIQRRKNQGVLDRAVEHERVHGLLTLSVLSVFEIVQGWHHAGRPERATIFLEWASGREVVPIEPQVVVEGEVARVVLPGEPGYVA